MGSILIADDLPLSCNNLPRGRSEGKFAQASEGRGFVTISKDDFRKWELIWIF